jgi:hypothetical protein
MPHNLPYLNSPGTIDRLFPAIMKAAVPDKVTQSFIQKTLNIKGGTGATCAPFLKKIGFVNPDGTPSTIYKNFRNPEKSKKVIAEVLRKSYEAMYNTNERVYELSEKEIKGIIVQVTGLDAESRAVEQIQQTFKYLKKYADFTLSEEESPVESAGTQETISSPIIESAGDKTSKINLSYTIYLNLPNTSDINVFNSIFKALKDNLLVR